MTGDPVALEKGMGNNLSGQADFSVSAEGTLVIVPDVPNHYWWVDRTGKRIDELKVPTAYGMEPGFRVTPDGSSVVLALPDLERASTDIYVVDRVGGQRSQLTFDPEFDLNPIWSPDGDRLMFTSRQQSKPGIYVRATQGGEPEKLLIPYFGTTLRAMDWSPDGSDVLVNTNRTGKNRNIMRLAMPNGSSIEEWWQTPFNEANPRFSPNGKWVAYQSDETGSTQIDLRSFPSDTTGASVTTAGGTLPGLGARRHKGVLSGSAWAPHGDPDPDRGPRWSQVRHRTCFPWGLRSRSVPRPTMSTRRAGSGCTFSMGPLYCTRRRSS